VVICRLEDGDDCDCGSKRCQDKILSDESGPNSSRSLPTRNSSSSSKSKWISCSRARQTQPPSSSCVHSPSSSKKYSSAMVLVQNHVVTDRAGVVRVGSNQTQEKGASRPRAAANQNPAKNLGHPQKPKDF
jgi:hypothetical protein